MKYVGDLSSQDASVLETFGRKSRSILEFGMGASTQVLGQSLAPGARLVSLETDPAWMARTRRNLDILGVPPEACELLPYQGWEESCAGRSFDFIFVDGVGHERDRFARAAFPLLEVGGWILFHDTRRAPDLRNLVELIMAHHTEVGETRINFDHSNLSGFQRKVPEPYQDWNVAEGRNEWMTGWAEPPDNWPDLLDTVQPLRTGAHQWNAVVSQRQYLGRVKEAFPDHFCGRKVLDLGCLGLGARDFFTGCDYQGLEPSALEGDGRPADSSFDVVLSCEALEHDPRWQYTLDHMIRLARPGGLVIVSCATVGRREHQAVPGQAPAYYRNLMPSDLVKGVDLSPLVAYDLASDWDAYALCFAGIKRPADAAGVDRLPERLGPLMDFYRGRHHSSLKWIRRSLRHRIKARLFGDRGPRSRC
jgi:SAM-dependent methyltransferase/precorrin-6B methylase 2